jgi:sugar-phosphatase
LSVHLFPRSFDALLFDMDGTILTSIKAAERVWGRWAEGHGLDVAAFLPTIHGFRAVETIRRLNLPGVDAEAEAAAVTAAEIDDVAGIEPIAGARAFLAGLPADRWAVVTSAPRPLALRRMAAAGLPVPALLVTADDVVRGKPAPDCFRIAAERLKASPQRCLVFEDAAPGIAAAEAAGCDVVVITATHQHAMQTRHMAVRDYANLRADVSRDGIRISAAVE